MTPKRIQEALAQAGYSNTQARRAIVTALCEARKQADPRYLLKLGRAYHPRLGQVTVYRTLEILVSLGLVRKLHRDNGCDGYVTTAGRHGHHLICTSCQKVIEFHECGIGPVIDQLQVQTSYQIEDHWLELFGVCPSCQEILGARRVTDQTRTESGAIVHARGISETRARRTTQ